MNKFNRDMKKYGTLQHIVLVAIVFAIISFLYDYFINDNIDFTGLVVKTVIFAPTSSLLMKMIKGEEK